MKKDCQTCRVPFSSENPQCGKQKICRKCNAASMLKWMAGNPNYKTQKAAYDRQYRKDHPRKRREGKLLYYFNISLEEYAVLLGKQDGVCAICKQPPTKKALCVDHDHETGKLRGLLCARCNCGLGYFRDSTDNIKSAREYLRGASNKTLYKVRTA